MAKIYDERRQMGKSQRFSSDNQQSQFRAGLMLKNDDLSLQVFTRLEATLTCFTDALLCLRSRRPHSGTSMPSGGVHPIRYIPTEGLRGLPSNFYRDPILFPAAEPPDGVIGRHRFNLCGDSAG